MTYDQAKQKILAILEDFRDDNDQDEYAELLADLQDEFGMFLDEVDGEFLSDEDDENEDEEEESGDADK